MQNKPNLPKAKMSANIYYTKGYSNETAFRRGKNKPNSNPNKPNLPRARNEYNLNCDKGLQGKMRLKAMKKQTQNKPNFFKYQNERKYLYHKGL